ncbi:hypothetical protein MOQ72_01685 [Saccharopolyspora sp. K220]|uniref:hypothetical protein n=1 Tax=Saccharopolyspora soli TaxID=2926618 RepID=UPI001F5991BC|nr:hypothetical protein [Saccharopolyspora soli]MCI2416122.1 hypothetical protein [Saccharopolyspora soli]
MAHIERCSAAPNSGNPVHAGRFRTSGDRNHRRASAVHPIPRGTWGRSAQRRSANARIAGAATIRLIAEVVDNAMRISAAAATNARETARELQN